MLGKRIKMGHYMNVNKLKWKGGRLKREKIYVAASRETKPELKGEG